MSSGLVSQVFYLVNEAVTQISSGLLVDSMENSEERKISPDYQQSDNDNETNIKASTGDLVSLICMGLIWLTELCQASTPNIVAEI